MKITKGSSFLWLILFKEERWKGDPSVLLASYDKATKTLNWQPKFSELETIIKTALLFDENNKKNLFFVDDFVIFSIKFEEIVLRVEKIFHM